MEIEILAGLGIFLGCFGRTIFPFLKKKAESGGSVKWEGRYTWTVIFTVFLAGVTTMFILPSFQIPSNFVFPMAFIQGWGAEDIVNRVVK